MDIKLYTYFFINLYLILSGLLFLLPLFFRKKEEYEVVRRVFFSHWLQTLFSLAGIGLTALTCLFPMDNRLIIGDLLPAATTLAIALILLLGYVRHSKFLNRTMSQEGEKIVTALQIPTGIIALLIAILHIFIPGVPLL